MIKRICLVLCSAIFIFCCTSCVSVAIPFDEIFDDYIDYEIAPPQFDSDQKDATEYTVASNKAVYDSLEFSDRIEYEFAERGLIDAPDELELKDENGKVLWSQKAYDFVEKDSPATVNPSLWRNTQLNHYYGLFEVIEGIYQVRGYDMTNITFVAGDTGWIVFDPLMSVECSKAAMELVNGNLGERPVSAVIISHPHVDHYGGIKGIVSEEDVQSGKIPVIVPEHFTEHAVSESVYAGNAMARRASYQYGATIEPGEKGALGIGIGLGQSKGTVSFILPTMEITETGQRLTIDGIEMEFQLTPGTEAPVEMNTYFPQKRALWMAENCTATLHNLYTLRGAEVRDGNAWARYITEAITRYGNDTDVIFQSHNWPHFGNEYIKKYMEDTAAAYKYINDQTLMYLNQGYTSDEISNMIELPEPLWRNWYTRQYYGTVAHNSKAVYQKFMGWYDGNPVNLNPLSPADEARKFVEYLGDTNKVLQMAKHDFDRGEYQWVAQITNILVFDDPANTQARLLCADALEQLGYQAESGPWRNVYLTGAYELRHGSVTDESILSKSSADTKKSMTSEMMLDYLGILIDGQSAADKDVKINLDITDTGEQFYVHLYGGALLYYRDMQNPEADATLTLPRQAIFSIITGDEETQKENITIEGDSNIIQLLREDIVEFPRMFHIIEP